MSLDMDVGGWRAAYNSLVVSQNIRLRSQAFVVRGDLLPQWIASSHLARSRARPCITWRIWQHYPCIPIRQGKGLVLPLYLSGRRPKTSLQNLAMAHVHDMWVKSTIGPLHLGQFSNRLWSILANTPGIVCMWCMNLKWMSLWQWFMDTNRACL